MSSWILPMTDEDLGVLRRKKIFQLVLFIYLGVLNLVMFGFMLYLFIDGHERLMVYLVLAMVLLTSYSVWSIRNTYLKLKHDIEQGQKLAQQGVIQDKSSTKNSHSIMMNDVKFTANWKQYTLFDVGTEVLLVYAPESKVVLEIRGLNEEENSH